MFVFEEAIMTTTRTRTFHAPLCSLPPLFLYGFVGSANKVGRVLFLGLDVVRPSVS